MSPASTPTCLPLEPDVPRPTIEFENTITDNFHRSGHYLRTSVSLASARQSWAEMRLRTAITCAKARAAGRVNKSKTGRRSFILVTEYQRNLGICPLHARDNLVVYESGSTVVEEREEEEEVAEPVVGRKIMLRFGPRK